MISIVKNEQQLIRCLIDNPQLCEGVAIEYFITDIGKNLFLTIQELYEKGIDISKSHLLSFGNKRDESINQERINTLFDSVDYQIEAFSSYIERLKYDFVKYAIQKKDIPLLIEKSSERGQLKSEEIRKLLKDIESKIDSIEHTKKDFLFTPDRLLDKYLTVLQKRDKGELFYSCGDSYLDKYLTIGFAPKWITTVFGATGIGKSIFALHLVNKQINRQIPSLYISLEMDGISTMDRLIASRNRIPMDKLFPRFNQNENIPSYIFDTIESERNNLCKTKYFLFVEEPSLSFVDIKSLIKEAKKRMTTDYLIVTIDLLTMVREFNDIRVKKADQYENCMNILHEMAKSENVHFVGVVQANREADSVRISKISDIQKFKPSLNSIKNSGAIGERSRVVLSTFRNKYYADKYFPDEPETKLMQDIMEISILKQSMGSLGHLRYLYEGNIARLYRYKTAAEDENFSI